jgi:hypothetical protein
MRGGIGVDYQRQVINVMPALVGIILAQKYSQRSQSHVDGQVRHAGQGSRVESTLRSGQIAASPAVVGNERR